MGWLDSQPIDWEKAHLRQRREHTRHVSFVYTVYTRRVHHDLGLIATRRGLVIFTRLGGGKILD